MPTAPTTTSITPAQVLFPVVVLSFVVLIFLGFQTTLMVTDREEMEKAKAQQDAPLQQVEKIKGQATALALGTLKLSQEGDKNAETIIAQLKKAGINVVDQASPSPPSTPAPANDTPPAAK